jgi:hypothetical protein
MKCLMTAMTTSVIYPAPVATVSKTLTSSSANVRKPEVGSTWKLGKEAPFRQALHHLSHSTSKKILLNGLAIAVSWMFHWRPSQVASWAMTKGLKATGRQTWKGLHLVQ